MISPFFENIRFQIINELDEASTEILVAMYWFTNKELFAKLCSKLEQGIRVSLIIHNDFVNNRESGLDLSLFIDLGGNLYFSSLENPMHNKFCVIDKRTVVTGSYNWTYFAESKNSENILIIKNQVETVLAFHEEFIKLISTLTKIQEVDEIAINEIREFDSMSVREYVAKDLLHEAKETNKLSLVETALKLDPYNISVQEESLQLNLIKRKKLVHSIGVDTKGDEYFVCIKKGTIIPFSAVNILKTTNDNQRSCVTKVYFGDNQKASSNYSIKLLNPNKSKCELNLKNLPPKPLGTLKIKINASIDIGGILRVKFYHPDNDNVNHDFLSVDINEILSE